MAITQGAARPAGKEEERASNGQLEWDQVNETIRLLTVSIAQISLSLKVGNRSVDAVGAAFESLLSDIESIGRNIEGEQQVARQLCSNAAEQTRNFIFAFQFYDELSQRLDHVSRGLEGLSGIIADSERFSVPEEWQALKDAIRSKYTIQDEIEMFDAVMAGMDIDEAVQQVIDGRDRAQQQDNEVELF